MGGDIFSSKISALSFDLISTSVLPKAKINGTKEKKQNVRCCETFNSQEAPVLIALLRRRIQRQKQKYRERFWVRRTF